MPLHESRHDHQDADHGPDDRNDHLPLCHVHEDREHPQEHSTVRTKGKQPTFEPVSQPEPDCSCGCEHQEVNQIITDRRVGVDRLRGRDPGGNQNHECRHDRLPQEPFIIDPATQCEQYKRLHSEHAQQRRSIEQTDQPSRQHKRGRQ